MGAAPSHDEQEAQNLHGDAHHEQSNVPELFGLAAPQRDDVERQHAGHKAHHVQHVGKGRKKVLQDVCVGPSVPPALPGDAAHEPAPTRPRSMCRCPRPARTQGSKVANTRATPTSVPAITRRTTKSTNKSKLTPISTARKAGPGLPGRAHQRPRTLDGREVSTHTRSGECECECGARVPIAHKRLRGVVCVVARAEIGVPARQRRRGGIAATGGARTYPQQRDDVDSGEAHVPNDVGARVKEARCLAAARLAHRQLPRRRCKRRRRGRWGYLRRRHRARAAASAAGASSAVHARRRSVRLQQRVRVTR